MSFKNPKNLIVIGCVVAALLAGTVLLGGYANSKATAEAPAKACQATNSDAGCPAKANQAAFAQVSGDVQTATGCSETPCGEECTKPCCAEDTPKGCCGSSESTGCPMKATKTAAE